MDDLEAAWRLIDERPMNIVFIAGPYLGDGSHEAIEANIREAEAFAVALANLGIGFFCPHLHTRHFGDRATADEPFYHRLDFTHLVRVADAVLFTPRWMESSGARREHAWTNWRGLPCFYPNSVDDLEALVAWNEEHPPFDRLGLETWARETGTRLIDFGVLPGWNKRDEACAEELRTRTRTGLQHVPISLPR